MLYLASVEKVSSEERPLLSPLRQARDTEDQVYPVCQWDFHGLMWEVNINNIRRKYNAMMSDCCPLVLISMD